MARAARIARIVLPVLFTGVSTACLDGPAFMKQKGAANLSHTLAERQLVVVEKQADGSFAAVIDPTSKIAQTIEAGEGSAIEGTSVTFPPGALAIATQVTLREGAPIADRLRTELGLAESQIVGDKTPVEMESSTPVNGVKAFEIAIKIPDSFGLTQSADKGLALFYSLNDADAGTKIEGVFLEATGSLRVENGKVYFQVPNFGNYHLVRLFPVPKQQPAPIVKTEAKIALQSVRPYVAPAGATIEVKGANFRPTMKFAIGSVPLTNLKLKSDTAATFAMPAEVPFGFNELRAEKDSDGKNLKLFAQADKAALPLITVAPAGVCAGVDYYDANGDKQTGTMNCTTSSASGASWATSAAYAVGAEGSNVPVATTLVLPGNGSFYKVVGSGTVSGIAAAPAGTRASLAFAGSVVLVPSSTTSGLLMNRNRGYTTRANDVFEFVSLGGGTWREVGRSTSATRVVARVNTSQTIAHGASQFPVRADQELFDSLNEYNPATGVFTPIESGAYAVRISLRAYNPDIEPSTCSYPVSFRYYFYESPSKTISPQAYLTGSSCPDDYREVEIQFNTPLVAGRSYFIGVDYYNSSTNTPATLQSTSVDSLVIERVD